MKKVLEIVFIKDWNTHAYICEGGSIHVQLMVGRCFTRKEFFKDSICVGMNDDFIARRKNLFDELDQYYRKNYL